MVERIKNRRRRYLIEKEIQFSFIRIFIGMILPISLILGIILYSTNQNFGRTILSIAKENLNLPDSELNLRLGDLEMRFNAERVKAAFAIFGSILAYCIAIAILGIYITHRVAGPAYKMAKLLRLAKGGDYSTITLRKTDWLKGLASSFNEFIESLRKGRK
jgi:methyl-accepting chemotaxis protein